MHNKSLNKSYKMNLDKYVECHRRYDNQVFIQQTSNLDWL